MGDYVELALGTLKRLLKYEEGLPSSSTPAGRNIVHPQVSFSQLQLTKQMLGGLPKQQVAKHRPIHRELYFVVARVGLLVEDWVKSRNLDMEELVPVEKQEHLLEALFGLRWWTWMTAKLQEGDMFTHPEVSGTTYFLEVEGVTKLASEHTSDLPVRHLPSYRFELWMQKKGEQFSQEVIRQLTSDGRERDKGITSATHSYPVLDDFLEVSTFTIKGITSVSFPRRAGRPVSMKDTLTIDLTQDLLGVSTKATKSWVVRSSLQGEYCALKRIENIDEESPDLSKLSHPHIVDLMHFWREPMGYLFLVMELMDGDLAQYMTRDRTLPPFPLPVAVDIMLQIAKGMLYLHDMGFTHPHLKCSNVLFRSENGRLHNPDDYLIVKLGGFGSAKREVCSPDIVRKLDVKRFGLTCLELLTGKVQFENSWETDMDLRPDIPQTTPPSLEQCITICLGAQSMFPEIILMLLLAQCEILAYDGVEISRQSSDKGLALTESRVPDWPPQEKATSSSSSHQETYHVYQLYPEDDDPRETMNVEATIIFFHGFSKVPKEWRMTWMTRDNKHLWPQVWLPEDLRGHIRVLSVSYDAHQFKGSNDVAEIGRNLLQSLLSRPNWKLADPQQLIFLVGHGFGGLIIKSLVLEANNHGIIAQSRSQYEWTEICKTFISNLKGIFFFSVPHSTHKEQVFKDYLSGCGQTRHIFRRNSFLQSLLRNSEEFNRQMVGLCLEFEKKVPDNTKIQLFVGGKPLSKNHDVLVTEASTEGTCQKWDCCKIDGDNHFEVCRPHSKEHKGYKELVLSIQGYMMTSEDSQRLGKLEGDSNLELQDNPDGKRKRALSKKERNKKKRRMEDVNEVTVFDSQDLSPEALGSYDVFLNHRGPDVKGSFVSHLYDLLRVRGCNPFLDAKDLIKGKHALNSINEALHGVRVHVAIFSKGYAESKYCLNELCDMMKSPEKVIPVFFGVDPEHLRWIENGPFAAAFKKHLAKIRDKDVERWKTALFEASHLSGFLLSNFKDESALKKDIVARVLKAFGPAQLRLPWYLVGLEQSSEVVLDILNQMGNTVGVVGITGMGGIGKTTLATHVYNEQDNFSCRSFLKDVKDANMAKLKAKMVWDLLQEDMKKIGDFECCFRQFKNKKIFVVIDDIEHRSQFDELIPYMKDLAGGSRVLITSRDRKLLNNIMRDAGEKKLYEMQVLSPSDSLRLFIRSAFHNDIPSAKLHDLSSQIAQACGGLPLALEVIGGILFDKRGDERLWYEAISTLHKNEDILDCLKLSYTSLHKVEQEMFLDIAFFLAGALKDVALEFWNSDDFFSPAYAPLCKLIDRCLLKVDENGFLTMHDLLRDMGRDVVMKKSPRNEGKQSHLCNPSSVIKVLEKNKGTKKVRGLSTSGIHKSVIGNEAVCQAERFASLNELQILILEDCDVNGDFSKWSRELRWLQWRQFYLPELPLDLQLPNLMVLDLAYSNHLYCILPKDFELQFMFPRLHLLNLEGCINLRELPQHIDRLSLLKILHLNSCYRLQSLPTSIGGLKKLTVLNISKSGVDELPKDFGELQSLEEFNASSCYFLSSLPESFGDLSNLKRLHLDACYQLQSLPTSIGGLKTLTVLNISKSGVKELPKDFGELQSLEEFNASSCYSLSILPESFGDLSNLKKLHLDACYQLQSLPTSIGGLKKLTVLNISNSGVEELPKDFGELQSLEEFNASSCYSLSILPESFGDLSNLKRLHLDACYQLQSLPTSIGGLTKLTVLNISKSGVDELPKDFGELQSLEEFNASNCYSLSSLPESFGDLSNLKRLHLDVCYQLQSLPTSIGGLTKLTVLNISKSGVEELPKDFGELQSLEEFNASSCYFLSSLPESFGDLSNLKRLHLDACYQLQSLHTSIGGLKKLTVLNMSTSGVEELPKDFGELQSLEEFNASGC